MGWKPVSIVRKMMIGYVCIICLPVVSFGFYYYNQIGGMVMEKIDINHRQMMEQAYNNLKVDLAHYESLYKFVQANPFIVEYLDGAYKTDVESVYNYLAYIYPQLMYLESGNPNITDITIYKYKSNVLRIPNHIADLSSLDLAVRRKIGRLKPNQGIWLYQLDQNRLTALYYYQVLYNRNYTDEIGIMEIKISANVLLNFLKALRADSNWAVQLQNDQGETIAIAAEGEPSDGDSAAQAAAHFRPGKFAWVNRLRIDSLGLNVVAYGKEDDMFRDIKVKETYLAVLAILLLLSLSFVYNLLVSSVAKRLSRLARHMRSVGDNNLKIYPSTGDMDEIGFLTSSYNAMVQRIEELIDKVHRTEVLRKEAAYRALQAQVKPHFLYNTLETIRMMAVARNVPEVAGITFAFGKLMRYSLSSSGTETKLEQEIEMVQSYLDIHRIRMKDRLQYTVEGAELVENVLCPRFILQPVVENCIVHGISKVRRSARIAITIAEDEECHIVTVEDNGGGIAEDRLAELRRTLNVPAEEPPPGDRGGFGLRNVAERIRAYYGGPSRLEIESEAGSGTRIRMFLSKKRDDAG
jgi:two-component system sensor histidine kinase YesM